MLDLIFSFVSDAWNEMTETTAGLNKTLSAVARNLELFTSVAIARFIVWRELRRLRKQTHTATGLR